MACGVVVGTANAGVLNAIVEKVAWRRTEGTDLVGEGRMGGCEYKRRNGNGDGGAVKGELIK